MKQLLEIMAELEQRLEHPDYEVSAGRAMPHTLSRGQADADAGALVLAALLLPLRHPAGHWRRRVVSLVVPRTATAALAGYWRASSA